jgi:hypothetical protein
MTLISAAGDPAEVMDARTAAKGGFAPGASGRCGWVPGFWSRDLDRDPTALEVFDDGTGFALYAVGRFRRANGRLVNGFASWNGNDWTALEDAGGTWGSGGAFSLAAYDDGAGAALYAGGVSIDPQGIGRPLVAKWDGAAWSEIGLLSNPAPRGGCFRAQSPGGTAPHGRR